MVSYIVMITFLLALNAIKAPVKYVIRTKYFFFIILFVDAYFKTQWINPFLTIFAVYMTITAIYLVSKFRSSV